MQAGVRLSGKRDLRAAWPSPSAHVFTVGVLPNLVTRPAIAMVTSRLPAGLSRFGFTGAMLSVGVVGVIAGPLAVAPLAASVILFSLDEMPVQHQLA